MVDSQGIHLGVVAATHRSSRWLRHSAGQRVCSRRLSDTTPQVSQAVVDQSFRSGVLIGDSPGTLSVRDHILLGLRGFAFELRGLVAHLPHLSTNRFMSRPAVTDFPEGAAQFCIRCFMGGPAVREFFESSGLIFAGALQFVLQAVLVFLGFVELLSHF